MSIFTGSCTAMITPFTENGVDYEALERLVEFQIAGGTDALVVNGTTGEPSTMTTEEKDKILETVIKIVNHRIPVIAGTGNNNTALSVEQSIKAEKAGAEGILVVTPYYNKCTQNGLIAHFTTIANAVGIPMIMYNVPARTGVNIQAATVAKCFEHKNIAAVKEASGNIEQIVDIGRYCDIDIYSGDDAITVPILSAGGKGVISVVSNVIPRFINKMVKTYFSGDASGALKMQHQMGALEKLMFCEVNPIPVKKACELMGLCNNIVRLPLTELESEHTECLKAEMKRMGII